MHYPHTTSSVAGSARIITLQTRRNSTGTLMIETIFPSGQTWTVFNSGSPAATLLAGCHRSVAACTTQISNAAPSPTWKIATCRYISDSWVVPLASIPRFLVVCSMTWKGCTTHRTQLSERLNPIEGVHCAVEAHSWRQISRSCMIWAIHRKCFMHIHC